jgi:cysteine desulfurase/selenocysteine lyase
VHYPSETATFEYEEARRKVQRFINAREDREVIFTSGTTDAINLVTHGYGRSSAPATIILTTLEHHSNIVPWQMPPRKRARIRVVPVETPGAPSSTPTRALQRAHEIRRRRTCRTRSARSTDCG